MSPSEDLARWLADEGVTGSFGGSEDWSAHVSREPAEPANVVTLYDVGGPDSLNLDGGEMRQPQIQVRVRGAVYSQAWDLQEIIRRVLVQPDAAEGMEPIERTIGTSRYVTMTPIGDILSIGRDNSDRHLVVANYQLIRQALEGES